MKRLTLTLLSALMLMAASAQTPSWETKIWEGTQPPTANGITEPEGDDGFHANKVSVPTLTVYVPQKPCGLAILACPGGGYTDVWYTYEGRDMAQWYLNQGITYAVLKYRVPNSHYQVPLEDVHRSMHLMRQHTQEWGFSKLGIQGCSAGGHLASTAATHFTNAENRPDFQILFYPVITMDKSFTHQGSRDNLLGKNPSQELVDLYSNEKQVTKQTPPAFIMHSSDDGIVPLRNSLDYCRALSDQGVSAVLHVYPVGGHGWAFHDWFVWKRQWTGELEEWLRRLDR